MDAYLNVTVAHRPPLARPRRRGSTAAPRPWPRPPACRWRSSRGPRRAAASPPQTPAQFLAPTLRDLLPDPLHPERHGRAADRFLQRGQVAPADRDLRRLRRRRRRLGGAADRLAARPWAAARRSTSPTASTRATAPTTPRDGGAGARPRPDPLRRLRHAQPRRRRRRAGADVVVLDHHLGGETLPAALAVVNPNRQDEDGSLGHLCAAGVVFLMLVEANRRLRGRRRRPART